MKSEDREAASCRARAEPAAPCSAACQSPRLLPRAIAARSMPLLDPPRGQHAAAGARAIGPAAEQIGAPAGGLLEEPLLLGVSPRISSSILRCRAWVIASTRGCQRADELACRPGVLVGHGARAASVEPRSRARDDGGRSSAVPPSSTMAPPQPGELRVLAVDDVLVGVVDVVLADTRSAPAWWRRKQRRLLAVELLQQGEAVGRFTRSVSPCR